MQSEAKVNEKISVDTAIQNWYENIKYNITYSRYDVEILGRTDLLKLTCAGSVYTFLSELEEKDRIDEKIARYVGDLANQLLDAVVRRGVVEPYEYGSDEWNEWLSSMWSILSLDVIWNSDLFMYDSCTGVITHKKQDYEFTITQVVKVKVKVTARNEEQARSRILETLGTDGNGNLSGDYTVLDLESVFHDTEMDFEMMKLSK